LSSTAFEQKPSSTTSERKNKSEKEENKKKVDVHLLATNALVIFWRSVFCNTTSAMSSTTPLQQCLLQHHFSNVFCNTTSTPLLQHCFNTPMQHCLLQQHFNITSITPSSTTLLLLLSDGKV
jgi:predicted NAD/FAD-binding protein